jgi:hypothetical protein
MVMVILSEQTATLFCVKYVHFLFDFEFRSYLYLIKYST